MESNVNKTLYKVIKVASTVLVVLLIVYGTVRASLLAFDYGYRVFTEPPMSSKPGTAVVVTITEDMGADDIGNHLLEKGLIRDDTLFWIQYQLSAYKGELLPGTYTLNTSMTAKEMMVIMAQQSEEDEEATDDGASSTENAESTEVDTGSEAE